MGQVSDEKWRGSVSSEARRATADQIWSLYKDFFNFHRWFPTLAECSGVHGVNGEVGCVRHCSGSSLPNGSGVEDSWSKERLVAVNEEERTLRYEIVDGNIGFRSYVATVKVAARGDGCVVEWGFEVAPVAGLSLEELVQKYEKGLRATVRKMEDDVADG
uniref:Lachrymatory factor synthase n=1 Tax=Kalanchoe fedtschenkoi TaxID=63787 RepID=A0A7N0ZZ77_KALFE